MRPITINININLKGFHMGTLNNAMAAVVEAIKANTAAVDTAHLSAIDEAIVGLQEHDASEDAELADVSDALRTLHDGLVTPSPAPPEPAPDTAP